MGATKTKVLTIVGSICTIILLGMSAWFFTHPRQVQLKQDKNVAQSILKNDKQKQALIFFREHCPYCEAATLKLLEAKKESKLPISFVNTRSNIGRVLVQKLGLVDASTIVVLDRGSARKYIYAIKKNGKIQADEETINQALRP